MFVIITIKKQKNKIKYNDKTFLNEAIKVVDGIRNSLFCFFFSWKLIFWFYKRKFHYEPRENYFFGWFFERKCFLFFFWISQNNIIVNWYVRIKNFFFWFLVSFFEHETFFWNLLISIWFHRRKYHWVEKYIFFWFLVVFLSAKIFLFIVI